MNQYTFFWKQSSPFSQWYSRDFSVDETVFNCAEQFMMHQNGAYGRDYLIELDRKLKQKFK